jgi:superfamily II DNA helicase RecQ
MGKNCYSLVTRNIHAMEIKIFTFFYRPELEGFDTSALHRFCLDKEVFEVQGHFFLREGRPCWTAWVRYRMAGDTNLPLSPSEPGIHWDERDRLLIQRLKAWRKEQASQRGIPHYLIFKNRELEMIVREKISTKAGLGDIQGFGRKKVAEFGEGIVQIVQAFLQEKPSDNA